jgi:hypothetical protein
MVKNNTIFGNYRQQHDFKQLVGNKSTMEAVVGGVAQSTPRYWIT